MDQTILVTPRYELWDKPPIRGYRGEYYLGDYRDYSGVILSLAGSAISILATFLGFSTENAKVLMALLLSLAANVIGLANAIGSSVNTRVTKYQAIHSYYPSYQIRNIPYVLDIKGDPTYGYGYYTYEWYSDPSGY